MRITDLLDKRSISLNGAPKSKEEALDQVVALMTKSGKINDEEAYRKQVYAGRRRAPQESVKESPFLTENVTRLTDPAWRPWL